jgi:hypothetical protein
VVNNSNNINKMNSHLSPQIIGHTKDHNIYWWKSRSWLQTGTKMSHSGRVKSTCCGLISDLNCATDSFITRNLTQLILVWSTFKSSTISHSVILTILTLILYEVKYSILKETTRVCNTNTPITGLICLVRKDNYRINPVTIQLSG